MLAALMKRIPDLSQTHVVPLSILALLLAVAGGACVFLSLAPYDLWFMGVVAALVFVCLCIPQRRQRDYFLLSLLFHFSMFATGVNWVYVSMHTFGQVPGALAAVFTAGFAVFLALLSSLPWLVFAKVGKTPAQRLLLAPVFWVLSEWSRGWLLTGFPWLYLGHGQAHTLLSGWLPLFGALGASLMVMLSASALVLLAQRSKQSAITAGLVLCMVWGGGGLLRQVSWTTPMGEPINVTLVQPNIALADKWNPALNQKIVNHIEALSEQHWHQRLVIWPEAAVPFFGEDALAYLDDLDQQLKPMNSALITGYLTYDEQQERAYNAIGGVGLGEGKYLKQRLVPFGEYVPLEDQLRGLINFFDLPMSIIAAGSDNQSGLVYQQQEQSVRIAPAICYEIAYGPLVADLAKDAQLIVTLSNDAWFADSIGPHQHMQLAQVRAVENRKPVLRVTNNGVTASVGSDGKILDQLPQFTSATLDTTVQPMSGSTVYSRFGNLPILLMLGLLILISFTLPRATKESSEA